MGKPKKDKRNKKDDDFEDDDVDPDIAALSLKDEQDPAPASEDKKAPKKKKKAKAVREESDSDDDDLDVLASLQYNEDDVYKIPEASAAKRRQRPKMSAFQMLDMLSDGDDDKEDEEPEEEEPEEVVAKPVKKSQKKEKKKAARTADDEDVEAVLAALDGEAAQRKDSVEDEPVKAQKKGKKGKKAKQEEEDLDALLASIEKPEEGKKGKKGKKKQEVESKTIESAEIPNVAASEPVDVSTLTLDDLVLPDDDSDDEAQEKAAQAEAVAEEGEEEAEAGSTVKTKAQKKKEKKEKEKKKKQEQKAKATAGEVKPGEEAKDDSETAPAQPPQPPAQPPQPQENKEPSPAGEEEEEKGDEDGDDAAAKKKKKDKKKKKTKEEKEEEEKAKKKPGKAKIKAMQEALAQMKEQEERQRQEQEEQERRAEEARLAEEEAERLEKERKEKTKLKKKEREQRLKAEGRWMSEKQKQDRRRALQMLEMMKEKGLELPQREDQPGERKKRVVYDKMRRKKPQQQQSTGDSAPATPEQTPTDTPLSTPAATPSATPAATPLEEREPPRFEKVLSPDAAADAPAASWDDGEAIKDDWDAESEDEDKKPQPTQAEAEPATVESEEGSDGEDLEAESEEEEEGSEEEEESSEEESSEESSEEEMSYAEKVRARAVARIQKRQEDNEKNRTTDVLRAPVVCVLGHVDTGKTKILDKLRRTHVQDGEAGGITQQIGATNVPLSAIRDQTKMVKEFAKEELRIPGLLIIDTPGHESFSNLRSRGSSLCDIAILVVDIMHGLEPQTLESIQLLKKRKTPFVVALNKVDRLFQWKTNPHADIGNTLKKQQKNTKDEFDDRVRNIIVEFAQQSLNVILFHENKNPKEWISLVPTSAHSGDGMGNLMALICDLTQTMLAKRLAYSEELQATVMEVKALPGLGTTLDVILVNGSLREGDTIVVAGQEGPIQTQIRGLLIPPPMKELRVKNQYEKLKEMRAAHGVKIIAKDLEKALPGLPMHVCYHADEVDIVKEEVANQLKNALNSIKLSERGVFVQASTLGSLEALLEFLKTSKIPYAGINIGPIHKKDVMRASVMLEHEIQYACILAFDVKVERDAQDLADSLGVRVFTADIIYHLFDAFMAFRDEYKKKKKDEFRLVAVFPCKLRILSQFVFNSRDPIVMGVSVEAGVVREGTPICVPSKDFVELGRITSLEMNNKTTDSARKGQDVCVKIEPVPGEAPKMFGRHFDAEDMLVSQVTRESIDAVKDYFREDMQKTDWQLMIELKKIFKIS